LCLLFTILFAQSFQPTVEELTVNTHYYLKLFNVTLPASFLMFTCFLYELTFESPQQRILIFESEIIKVFFTIVIFYLLTFLVAWWIDDLRSFLKQELRRKEDLARRKLIAKTPLQELKALQEKLNQGKNIVRGFSIQSFSFLQATNYLIAKFDLFIEQECQHFKDQQFIRTIRTISNRSCLIFFVLIHIPLVRFSPLFSLLTALFPCILDKRTKQEVYLGLNRLLGLLFLAHNDPKWRTEIFHRNNKLQNKIGIAKYLTLKEAQEAAVNYTIFVLGLFMALLFNYTYTIHLEPFFRVLSEMWIKFFDRLGFEVHFIRLVYLTIFQTKYLNESTFDPPELKGYMNRDTILDHLFLGLIILPLFLLALRYLTAPGHVMYESNLNCLFTPAAVLTFFFFTNWDILYMGVLVGLLNLLVTWRMLDPDDTSWMDYYRQFGHN